jgi:hypothetical protein
MNSMPTRMLIGNSHIISHSQTRDLTSEYCGCITSLQRGRGGHQFRITEVMQSRTGDRRQQGSVRPLLLIRTLATFWRAREISTIEIGG